MSIGSRLRAMREGQKLSQSDLETRTNLPNHYIERVENGDLVPPIETLEEIAGVLGILPYQFFYDEQAPPELPNLHNRKTTDEIVQQGTEKKSDLFQRICERVANSQEESGRFLMFRKIAKDKKQGGANQG